MVWLVLKTSFVFLHFSSFSIPTAFLQCFHFDFFPRRANAFSVVFGECFCVFASQQNFVISFLHFLRDDEEINYLLVAKHICEPLTEVVTNIGMKAHSNIGYWGLMGLKFFAGNDRIIYLPYACIANSKLFISIVN